MRTTHMIDATTFHNTFKRASNHNTVVNPFLDPYTSNLDIERVTPRVKPKWINKDAVKVRDQIHTLANIRSNAFAIYSLSYDLNVIADAVQTIIDCSNEMLILMKSLGRTAIATGGTEDGIAPPTCDETWVKTQRDTYRLYTDTKQLYRATNTIRAERTVDYLDESED